MHESTANATWSRMLQGNKRFAEGKAEHPWQDKETRNMLTDGQKPDAAVLACADSRVPPEIIFDQGLGDLFTVRTAGQMIDDVRLSVEGRKPIHYLGHAGGVMPTVEEMVEAAKKALKEVK